MTELDPNLPQPTKQIMKVTICCTINQAYAVGCPIVIKLSIKIMLSHAEYITTQFPVSVLAPQTSRISSRHILSYFAYYPQSPSV